MKLRCIMHRHRLLPCFAQNVERKTFIISGCSFLAHVVNFTCPCLPDASSEEDLTSFESHPSDVQLFYNNLRMTKIEVVASTSHDTQQRLVDSSTSSGVTPKSSHVRRSLEPERDVGLFVAESSKVKNLSHLFEDVPETFLYYTTK